MESRSIKTDADYRLALKRCSVLVDLDPERATSEGDELDALSISIERYENEHYPAEKPDPGGAWRFRLEQSGE
jgi:HTH-type transcriptional regulator/antitoxin HigA